MLFRCIHSTWMYFCNAVCLKVLLCAAITEVCTLLDINCYISTRQAWYSLYIPKHVILLWIPTFMYVMWGCLKTDKLHTYLLNCRTEIWSENTLSNYREWYSCWLQGAADNMWHFTFFELFSYNEFWEMQHIVTLTVTKTQYVKP